MTGLVNQELLLQNEYLAAENRILKARLQPGWRLSDGERATLAEIGKRLGRKGLQVARLAKPDTILAWYRRLVAEKFDGSQQRRPPGRPRTRPEIEDLMVRLARENCTNRGMCLSPLPQSAFAPEPFCGCSTTRRSGPKREQSCRKTPVVPS